MLRIIFVAVCGLMLASCKHARTESPSNAPPARATTTPPPPVHIDQPILMGATSFRYTVGDDAGQPLAYGTLIIPWPVNDGQTFRGTWQSRPVLPSTTQPTRDVARIGPQLGGGQLAGERSGNTIRFDLNPGMRDNNVTLAGELDASGTKLVGLWSWSTIAGKSAGGKFAAQLAD